LPPMPPFSFISLTANWAALIRFGPCAEALETAITHPTGITSGNGWKAGTQPGSKPAINKEAKATNKYTALIFHSRGKFISSAADHAFPLYHFQLMPWRLVFTDGTNQCKILR
jgi:hypothetical protein